MRAIVRPDALITKLWGNGKTDPNAVYRLMHYILSVQKGGRTYLQNMVTGELAEMDEEETRLIGSLPAEYSAAMDPLIRARFLVPVDSDEYSAVRGLREVLIRLKEARKGKEITHYTILPTTACNARCYYCFEKGIKPVTMSDETVDDTVAFINGHCGGKAVHLHWFGGEPTVASERIRRICGGLRERGVEYTSSMTTNGYLLGPEMIAEAVSEWKLQLVHISLDGMEANYNAIKAYVGVKGSPFETVMRNITAMLAAGIRTDLRMNLDIGNYADYEELRAELIRRNGEHPLMSLRVHAVNDTPGVNQDRREHGDNEWFERSLVELNGKSIHSERHILVTPKLNSNTCQAASPNSITITADGSLVRCPEQCGDHDVVGNLKNGIMDGKRYEGWKKIRDMEQCEKCSLFPKCFRVLKCAAGERCQSRQKEGSYYRKMILELLE